MPKVTIWIRKEDEAKWKAIKDKPQFIHGAIKDYTELNERGSLEALKYIVDDRTKVMPASAESHPTFFKDKKK